MRLLGIEWANKYYKYCADRMARWQISNVRVMRADAKFFILHHLPPRCVSVLHLYHPDPWPKARHHKRRLVQTDFVEAAARVLEADGRWLIQSDHQEYFEIIQEQIAGCAAFTEMPWAQATVATDPEWAGTNFEVKYTREGRDIHRVAYVRR